MDRRTIRDPAKDGEVDIAAMPPRKRRRIMKAAEAFMRGLREAER
jgi:hypothetical protein